MSFACEITVPPINSETLVLRKWLASEGSLLGWAAELFVLSDGENEMVFQTNMPVYVDQLLIKPGTGLAPGQVIAIVLAEGDEIPYGRPYVAQKLA